MDKAVEKFQSESSVCKPADHAPCPRGERALLCIDLQYLGCTEGFGFLESHRQSGVKEAIIQSYLKRLKQTVLPNVARLQDIFRRHGLEVIHFHIQSLTGDGRDRSPEHKRLGLHAPPGSRQAAFLPEVAPKGDEIVFSKTASGVFISTNLEYVLRNLCITDLFITGVYTNECISSAVRGACDLGFQVTLAADGTAAITRELHEASLLTLHNRYGKVRSTDDIIRSLKEEIKQE